MNKKGRVPVEVPATAPGEGDQISAILVGRGYTVEVFRHPDFRGTKLTFYGPRTVTQADLAAYDMNDQISAYKLYETPPLVLRQHPFYDAQGWEIVALDPGSVSSVDSGRHDEISGILIADGYSVEVYEHPNFGGHRHIYHGPRTVSLWDLQNDGLNDKISSYAFYETPSPW